MQLYVGSSNQFIKDTVQNRVAETMKTRFFDYFRYYPPVAEVNSWRNSLRALCNVFQYASITDHGVTLEYQLPLTSKRLDCMVTGKDAAAKGNAVIIELKQWDSVEPSNVHDCVCTYVGQARRDVLHPSRQVGNYQEYLKDCHTAFSSGNVGLTSCGYLHNLKYDPGNELFSSRHAHLLEAYPLFSGDQTDSFAEYLNRSLGKGGGLSVLETVLKSRYEVSKKLLDHTHEVIHGQNVYVLLDEQQVVFNSVLEVARRAREDYGKLGKTVVLIKGGPGTGKSVIALYLIAELSALGFNTQHATGSRAFTENIRKLVGVRAGNQFRYFNSYSEAQSNIVDILVCDEAHRIRPASNNRFTPATKKSGKAQIQELIDCSKVSAFFIDDLQVVRPGEIGSCDLIRAAAEKSKARIHEFELEAQFRCNGSDAFINWVDSTLGIRRTANILWDIDDPFEFRIVGDVRDLEKLIRLRAREGFSSRLVAGFCWPWSNPRPGGELVADVQINGWQLPWNAKPDSTRLAAGIPKSNYWASDPNGINQVGCVYTAQGFEFDYCGVIFGKDLRYNPSTGKWLGDRRVSQDTVVKRSKDDKFLDLVKNTYRVLLTRAMKGCYVYFQDDETRKFFLSRTEKASSPELESFVAEP